MIIQQKKIIFNSFIKVIKPFLYIFLIYFDNIYKSVVILFNRKELLMTTNKTPFTFNIKNEYLEKMRYIAKRETRSLSNLLEHLCKLYIEKYEQDNEEIKINHSN